jgi:hypothetical protein
MKFNMNSMSPEVTNSLSMSLLLPPIDMPTTMLSSTIGDFFIKTRRNFSPKSIKIPSKINFLCDFKTLLFTVLCVFFARGALIGKISEKPKFNLRMMEFYQEIFEI